MTGQKGFQGSILAHEIVGVTLSVSARVETYAELTVNASGNVQAGNAQQYISQLYFLTVNTTGWLNLTQTFSPYDPYSKNATRIPMLSVQSPGKSLYADAKTAPGDDVVVDGRIQYFDESGNMRPLRHANVRLQDDHFCIAGCFQRQTTTDDTGFFTFDVVNPPNPFSPHLRAFPESEVENVKPDCAFRACWYEMDIGQVGSNVPNPSVIHAGFRIAMGYNELGWIFDAIYSGYLRLQAYGFNQYWSQGATWPTGNFPFTIIFGGIFINIPSEANSLQPWNHAAVQHEYGHTIMFQIMGQPASCCNGQRHVITSELDGGFALGEGWAEFIQAFVDNNPNNVGGPGNLEINSWYNVVACAVMFCGGDMGDRDGNAVEGSVASIFWDIYDDTPGEIYPCPGAVSPPAGYTCGGTDTLRLTSLTAILGPGGAGGARGGIFPDNHPRDMLEFFTYYSARNPGALTGLCEVYSGNGIDPPACRGIGPTPVFAEMIFLVAVTTIGASTLLRRCLRWPRTSAVR